MTIDSFREVIRKELNKRSIDNSINTPDFILADYLCECLEAFEEFIGNPDCLQVTFLKPTDRASVYIERIFKNLNNALKKRQHYKIDEKGEIITPKCECRGKGCYWCER